MFEFIYEYVDKDQFFKYFRLAILVGAYIFFRQIYSNYMKVKQVQRQITADQELAANKKELDRKKKQELEQKLEKEAQSFGWGKKTRKNVKMAQTLIQEQADDIRVAHQTAYDAAEDHDIEDLLED